MATSTQHTAVPLNGQAEQQESLADVSGLESGQPDSANTVLDTDAVAAAGAQEAGKGLGLDLSGAEPGIASFTSFAEFGAALRAARERAGLTPGDMVDKLKLSLSVIEHMEAGAIEKIPHSAYAKGFLRSYASFVKIPRESYEKLLQTLAPEPAMQQSVYTPDKTARPRLKSPWIGILCSLLMASTAAFLIWHFKLIDLIIQEESTEPQTVVPMPSSTAAAAYDQERRGLSPEVLAARSRAAQEGGQNANQNAAGSGSGAGAMPGEDNNRLVLTGNMRDAARVNPNLPAGSGSAVSEGSPHKVLSLVDPGEREPLPAVVPADSPWSTLQGNATIAGAAGLAGPASDSQDTGSQNITSSTNPNLPASPDSLPQSGPNTVVVVAESMCWTQVTVDGARSVQRTLQSGETMSVGFVNKMTLRLGNAGGVRVFYNNVEMDRGRAGQVRNMVFPPREGTRSGR